MADKNNPHGVTKTQIGLGNVENKSSATIRGELTGANITAALGYTPINIAEKGATNGLAELDENGMVPSSQLPSYVDDVSEHDSLSAFPAVGEGGKIYMALDTNKTYRWSGTTYVEISPSLALGETSSTAYRGDRGKIAYEHSQKTSGNPHGVTKTDVGLGNVPNVATDDQTPTYTVATTLTALESGEKISTAFGKIAKAVSTLISHISTSATTSVLGHVKVDSSLSTTSTNPVQNKIINSKIAYDVSGEELIEDFDYENWIVERAEGGGIEYPSNTLERFERLIAQCVEASIKLNDSLPAFKIYTGTTGSAGYASVSFTLPDGWTKDNCWIASFETLNPNGSPEYIEWKVVYDISSASVRLTENKVYVYLAGAASSTLYNKPFKVVVGHIK